MVSERWNLPAHLMTDIIYSSPTYTEKLGTVDFIQDGKTLIFRTCKEEKDRVVFQLGRSFAHPPSLSTTLNLTTHAMLSHFHQARVMLSGQSKRLS